MVDELTEQVEPSTWVWIDRQPTVEEMLAKLKEVRPVYGVEIIDYADFVLPLNQRQKMKRNGSEEYVETWRLYCTVAGRVKMLNDAATDHGWAVEESWDVIHDNPITVRIGVRVNVDESTMGIRYGVSKTKGGDTAWEKAETAARGRAIAAWGFGVLPGSGIASLEEMQDAMFGERSPRQQVKEDRPKDQVVAEVKAKIERLRQLRNQDARELDENLQAYIKDRLGQAVTISESGLDLAKLKPGNLLLLEGQLNSKITEEERRQSEI